MTGNTRVREERHFSEIAGKISATDAHAVCPHDGFISGTLRDVLASDEIDLGGSGELDG